MYSSIISDMSHSLKLTFLLPSVIATNYFTDLICTLSGATLYTKKPLKENQKHYDITFSVVVVVNPRRMK